MKLFLKNWKPNLLSFSDLFILKFGLMSRVFANGPGDQSSIPVRVMPMTQKMVLDTALLSTRNYKVRIKDKVEKSREWSSTLPYTSVL